MRVIKLGRLPRLERIKTASLRHTCSLTCTLNWDVCRDLSGLKRFALPLPDQQYVLLGRLPRLERIKTVQRWMDALFFKNTWDVCRD